MFEMRQDLPERGIYYGTAGPLAGLTKKRHKKQKQSGSKGDAKGKMKLVSYCPECPIPSMVHPESAPHVVVSFGAKEGSCKSGHIWSIR